MQTVKQATGRGIFTKRNFWKLKAKAGEVQSVEFTLDETTEIGALSINANLIPLGSQSLEVSLSRVAGEMDNPIDRVNYSGYGRNMVFTTDENYNPGEFNDFDFNGGSYGDTRPDRVYLKPGTYYINTRAINPNAAFPNGQPVTVIIQATEVTKNGRTFNQVRTNDRIEAKLDYIIEKIETADIQ